MLTEVPHSVSFSRMAPLARMTLDLVDPCPSCMFVVPPRGSDVAETQATRSPAISAISLKPAMHMLGGAKT